MPSYKENESSNLLMGTVAGKAKEVVGMMESKLLKSKSGSGEDNKDKKKKNRNFCGGFSDVFLKRFYDQLIITNGFRVTPDY